MEYYASVIQKLQNELGLRVSSLHDIALPSLKFYSSSCSQYLNNNNKEITQEEMLRNEYNDRFTS